MSDLRQLSADSEAHEPLDGLDQTYLVLSGNSCSLAPWDAKLGFQVVPFVASLTSLSADGGVISSMHVVIDKSFPLAFMSGDKGKKETPWDEAEEARREAAWMVSTPISYIQLTKQDARENEAIGIQEEVASLREAGSFDQALELEAQLEVRVCHFGEHELIRCRSSVLRDSPDHSASYGSRMPGRRCEIPRALVCSPSGMLNTSQKTS